MDGETNGSQQEAQGTQGQEGQQQETQGQQEVTCGNSSTDYEKQIAERDEKIASLEAQVAEAAKNAETAASDEGKTLKHWREIAGLTDDDDRGRPSRAFSTPAAAWRAQVATQRKSSFRRSP